MFIVYQNGEEIVPLHHAYVMYGEFMHFSPEGGRANTLATYPTQAEAKAVFDTMIYNLEAGINCYRLPQPRQTTSEPFNPY